GDFRPEEPLLERPRQFSPAILEVFQVIAIRQQIKNKNFHEYVDTYRFDSIFTHVRVMGQCLIRVMGAAPPWGQSLLRSCLASHSFPPPPPATCYARAERRTCRHVVRRSVWLRWIETVRNRATPMRAKPHQAGVGAGRSAKRGTSAATTGPRGAQPP